jgi:hypothetical protein
MSLYLSRAVPIGESPRPRENQIGSKARRERFGGFHRSNESRWQSSRNCSRANSEDGRLPRFVDWSMLWSILDLYRSPHLCQVWALTPMSWDRRSAIDRSTTKSLFAMTALDRSSIATCNLRSRPNRSRAYRSSLIHRLGNFSVNNHFPDDREISMNRCKTSLERKRVEKSSIWKRVDW